MKEVDEVAREGNSGCPVSYRGGQDSKQDVVPIRITRYGTADKSKHTRELPLGTEERNN